MDHKLPAMNALRALSSLRWWVLAWFVLALGAAVASPIVQPQTMELVCSGAGTAHVVVHTDQGTVKLDAPGLDCSLCLLAGAAPATIYSLAHGPATWRCLVAVPPASAPVLATTAVPPPARGPPFSFPLSYS